MLDTDFYLSADALLALNFATKFVLGAFFFFFFVQLFFFLARYGRVAFAGVKDAEAAKVAARRVGVSVVVCCHNNIEGLKALLAQLAGQDHERMEIVIVDDRSDDGGYDYLLAEAGRPNAQFKLVRINETPEHLNAKKYALTLGIKAAKHELILLTDSDCLPATKSWVSAMVAGFAGGAEVVLGYSPYSASSGALNSLVRFDTFFTGLQYLSFAMAGKAYMGVGRNLAYKKSFFLDNKGFRQHLGVMGGDDDLLVNTAAKGTKVAVVMEKDAMVISEPKGTFGAWWVQKVRHLSVGKKYRRGDQFSLGLAMLSLIGFYACTLALVWVPTLTFLVLLTFLVRTLVVTIIYVRSSRRMSERFGWYQWPLLDAWMPIHYIVFGLPAIFSKRISWS